MRKALCVVILALSFFAPVQRLDVAKLQPVQTVAVYWRGDAVALETDTGDVGYGATAEEALEDLKADAISVIYLNTAEYLLVGEKAQMQAEGLRPYLNGSVKVGEYRGGDVKEETEYWEIHGDLPKLKKWKAAP